MSYAEDNGLDDYDEDVNLYDELEELWKKGLHKTREGKTLRIKEMTTSHIKNTIEYFYGCDISPLQEELDKRLKNK